MRLGARRIVTFNSGPTPESLSAIASPGLDATEADAAACSNPETRWFAGCGDSTLLHLRKLTDGAVIVCLDVIERLEDPRTFLRFLRERLDDTHGLVISIPDRDRAGDAASLDPPVDPTRKAAWSFEEFGLLLQTQQLHPLLHGFTRDSAMTQTRHAQIAFIPGGRSGLLGCDGSATEPVTMLAFVPCYNEMDIISTTVDRLLSQGIDVHVLDNWSSDGSWEQLVARYAARRTVTLERFPERPATQYQWEAMLERVDMLAAMAPHAWILHIDADEQIESISEKLSIRDVLTLADRGGFDIVDFTLIDFRPSDENESEAAIHVSATLPRRWEFATRPGARSLERAWRNRRSPVGLSAKGGHALTVPKRIFPVNMILRHYPLRSRAHAIRKIFQDRLPRFGEEKRVKGWHQQYDCFPADASFRWSATELEEWTAETPREFVVEFATRQGLVFGDFSLPKGFQ